MNFLALLTQLEEVSNGNEHVADLLVRDIFSYGLFKSLKDKVEWECPKTFHEAIQVARKKFRKMMYKLHKVVVETERLPSHRRYEKIGIFFGPSPKGVTRSQLKIDDPHPQIQLRAAKDPNKVPPHMEEAECTKEVIFEIVDMVASEGSNKEEDSLNLKHEEELMIMVSTIDRSITNQQVVFAQKEEEERSRFEMAEKVQVVPNTEGKLQHEFEVNSFPTYSLEDAPSFESKGEGFLPQEDLTLSDLAHESEATCFVKELLCNNIGFVDEKLEVALIPSNRPLLGVGKDNGLETGASSRPLLQFNEDQEMCDTSGLGAFSGCNYGVAKLLGIFLKDSSNFDAKEDAVVSLGLYFIKDSNREEERKSGNLKAESKIEEAKADRLVNDNQQVTPSKVEVIQGEEMIGSNPTFFHRGGIWF